MPLNATEIKELMDRSFPDKLCITPILSQAQIEDGHASVDVRLGQEFIVSDKSRVVEVDSCNQDAVNLYLRKVHVPFGDDFILHPRSFALGSTLEYLRFPGDISAQVLGRSRWARVGLVIAMATFVHPWYAGCLTLELQNLGDAPIRLKPGMCIAQLVFDKCNEVGQRNVNQITCAIGPELPTLLNEEEKELLDKFK